MGNDMWKFFQGLFNNGQGQQQNQVPDIEKIGTMQQLLPQDSVLNPQALAGANQLGGILNGPAAPAAGYNPSFMNKMTGYTDGEGIKHNGWGGLALGAGQGIMGAWMGNKQLKQGQSQLDESKRQFNQNFEANRSLTNTSMEDRQRARVASNPGAYESVGSYMKKNEV